MKFFEKMNLNNLESKRSKLYTRCPWAIMASPGIVKIKGDAYTCACEFIAPDLSSASASKIESVANMFNEGIIRLGQNWTVQFELQRRITKKYPTPKEWNNLTGMLVDRIRQLNFENSDGYFQNRYFLIFTKKLESKIEKKAKGFFFNSEKSVKNVSIEVENEIKDIQDFKMQVSNVISMLKTVMQVNMLNSNELVTLLHSQVSMKWHELTLPEDGMLFLDRIITDESLQNSIPLKLGDHYIPIVSIKSFPGSSTSAMMNRLNMADCEFRWSTRFICYGKEQTLQILDKAEKKYHGKLQSMGQLIMSTIGHIESSRVNSTALAQEDEVKQAKIRVTNDEIGFGDYCSEVMVWDTNKKIADEKAEYISNIVNSCGFVTVTESLNALSAWSSMMAGNIYANQRELFVSTKNTSHAVPLSSIWSGMQKNSFMESICGESIPLLICKTEYRIPYFLNLNVNQVGHTWISGKTGYGKSTLLAALEIAWRKYPGNQVIIFDKGLSARNLTMCTGGIYIEPGKDKIGMQPLADIDTLEGKNWACEFIQIMLEEQKISVTAKMRKAIYDTINLLSTKKRESRTLTSFQQYCDYQDPVSHVNEINEGLSPYVLGGQYGEMFDCNYSNIDISDWTMFEMGTLMNMGNAAVAPALDYLFAQCEKKFTGRPTMLVLDEAWLYFKNKIFAAKIVEWLKTLRKSHVFVVFATQEIADAVNSDIATTLISQCPSKIFLPDIESESDINFELYKKLGLEDSEIRHLSKLQPLRDYFYKSTQGARTFNLDLEQIQLAIMTNSKEEHLLLDEIEKEYGRNSGKELVVQILNAKGVDFKWLLPELNEKEQEEEDLQYEKA